MQERGAGGELGVVNAVAAELGTETRIGPGEVWCRGRVLVLLRDEVDKLDISRLQYRQLATHLIALGLNVGLEEAVLN